MRLFQLNADGFFPRMCTVNSKGNHKFQMFTDTSRFEYGGVACVTSHSGNTSSQVLCARSKLCGILFGLKILGNLINILNQKINFASVHLWADAKVPLSRICSDIPHSLKFIVTEPKKANIIIGKPIIFYPVIAKVIAHALPIIFYPGIAMVIAHALHLTVSSLNRFPVESGIC